METHACAPLAGSTPMTPPPVGVQGIRVTVFSTSSPKSLTKIRPWALTAMPNG